ncbi:MAG: phenylalanine--tRNA ligase subunit beta [Candidatus Magasanikbacteria bacterium CG10_big_fil_rev_8_21_14_0_10_36_16]|uniref:Phenylalanine--tRNA ligase beta subunit n=1 Tax=Candidatus Magasanikbacteria bacterium CG10_big_fil_rev_8_21_14_0_10_36_16 TaxID=1974645 RepID=A0A2H0TY33_9BACT|nr:MAG: phenylalanine--tRNA ligase subunit beta [Candidatus Magasanikbacteria bacterium CG10_big_fil_rev_8_21_14_0_10_36_16]
MKISFKWLKQYVDLSESILAEEVAARLKASTVEVEELIDLSKSFENIVVGQVKSIEKHSDADKLNVCSVFDGKENWQVVCGGSNVVKDMKVAFAKIGAKVKWHGEGDLIELSKAKIRGVESFGMICASEEIGLGEKFKSKSEKEILDLSSLDLKVGDNLAKALNLDDAIFDIDNKSLSNRPDLWGHYGIAREVSALFNKKLKEYKTEEIKFSKNGGQKLSAKVEDNNLCPRYMVLEMDNIKVADSPEWLKTKLSAVGLKSINNIVDITNFIMFDLGQPMHAFDKAKIFGTEIFVRKAKDGEKFMALDNNEYELKSSDLVIADNEKVVALAGIMGGQNSEITENTTNIIFESANFGASNIRKTSTRLGLRSDSSARFEKSLDPNMTKIAMQKAIELVMQVCPEAKIVNKLVDEKSFSLNQGPIEISLEFIKAKLGLEIEKKNVINILSNLGFVITEKKDKMFVKIPTWRATKDISIPEDLVEEIARVYGYSKIEATLPTFIINPPEKNKLRDLERKAQQILSKTCGFTESYSYSFVSPQILQKLMLNTENHLELNNPIAKDRPYLRRSILPNLLESLEKNSHEFDEVAMFEIGQVFHVEESGVRMEEKSDELLPRQDTMLSLVYSAKNNKVPFFEVKSALEKVLAECGVDFSWQESEIIENYLHPARLSKVVINDVEIGIVAELHPAVQKNIGIDNRVAVTEISLDKLVDFIQEKNNYQILSQYPDVLRDVALLVDKKITNLELLNTIKAVSDLITEVELFDVFESDKIGKDKKSMAYHITYSSSEKTLETEEVEKVHKQVLEKLQKSFGAEVR